MKQYLYLLFFLFIVIHSFSQEAFKAEEHLKYKLSYSNFFTAGYATMDIKKEKHKNKDVFHVVGKGKTTGLINWFFKVVDNYETFIYKDTALPYRFIREINEGGYTKNKEIFFNQKDKKATVLNKKENTNKVYSLTKPVQDILSALYYMRNKDITTFKKGDEIIVPIFIDEEIMEMKLRFLGRETIDTKFGSIKTAKFMPLVASGRVFKEQESVTIWVSDDYNKIPLRIKASLAVGSLRADIYNFKNLQNPIVFK